VYVIQFAAEYADDYDVDDDETCTREVDGGRLRGPFVCSVLRPIQCLTKPRGAESPEDLTAARRGAARMQRVLRQRVISFTSFTPSRRCREATPPRGAVGDRGRTTGPTRADRAVTERKRSRTIRVVFDGGRKLNQGIESAAAAAVEGQSGRASRDALLSVSQDREKARDILDTR